MIIAGIIVGWIVMAAVGYVLVRRSYRRDGRPWRIGDRAYWLPASLCFAPIVFLLSIAVTVLDSVQSIDWPIDWSAEAKW